MDGSAVKVLNSFSPRDMSQTVEKCPSHDVEESFTEFLDPNPDADAKIQPVLPCPKIYLWQNFHKDQ